MQVTDSAPTRRGLKPSNSAIRSTASTSGDRLRPDAEGIETSRIEQTDETGYPVTDSAPTLRGLKHNTAGETGIMGEHVTDAAPTLRGLELTIP